MTAIGTYRKCYKCGCITNNVEATKCECGGFLYLISQYICQRQRKSSKRKKASNAASRLESEVKQWERVHII